MTRLRQPERQVLDTLVDAGVARSRSDALAWSVRLVGEHADEWLAKLRDAMSTSMTYAQGSRTLGDRQLKGIPDSCPPSARYVLCVEEFGRDVERTSDPE